MTSRALVPKLRAALPALGLILSPPAMAAAFAQTSGATPEILQQHDKELEAVRAERRKALETERKLQLEIESIGADRRRLNQAMIDAAARVRDGEAAIVATEERLKPLEGQESALRGALESKRAVIAEVLAALQRIGRRPPPAMLLGPEDALQSLRTAMLLGAVLPEMKEQAEAIVRDISELVRVREDIAAARAARERELAALLEEQQRMAGLIEERQKKRADIEKAIEEEKQRADALARQAETIKDLVAGLEKTLDSASRTARATARAAEESKATAERRPELALLNDPGRLAPAVAFAAAQGKLPLPVNGVRIREFGGSDGLGGTEKGISVATRAGAQVTSPCDGWVVYAAPYRNYGQLLILNAGGGYHVILAGMDRISVDLGQFVLTGEPVAIMGGRPQVSATVAAGSTQPVLYVEFRKDGAPVDPAPWWATREGEKVRG